MIRIEYVTEHPFEAKPQHRVSYEGTEAEARAFIDTMRQAGVNVAEVNYYDKDKREADIRAGRF